LKKYLPIFIVIGGSLVLLLFLTYWKPAQKDILDQSLWQVTLLDKNPLLEKTTLTLRFHNNKVNGSSGCNRFQGKYKVSGSDIEFTELEMGTERCMNPGIMEQETFFNNLLLNCTSFKLETGQLTFFTQEGHEVALIPLEVEP
jgi:putative lipoprotein